MHQIAGFDFHFCKNFLGEAPRTTTNGRGAPPRAIAAPIHSATSPPLLSEDLPLLSHIGKTLLKFHFSWPNLPFWIYLTNQRQPFKMSSDDMSKSDPRKEILPVLQWHYGTVKWRPWVDERWNCCSEMFSLDYWWIVSLCNTHGYVWKYILYSYLKGFGQVRFNFDDIWQRVNFDAQRVSEQTGKLSGGPRVFNPRVRQIFRATSHPASTCRSNGHHLGKFAWGSNLALVF